MVESLKVEFLKVKKMERCNRFVHWLVIVFVWFYCFYFLDIPCSWLLGTRHFLSVNLPNLISYLISFLGYFNVICYHSKLCCPWFPICDCPWLPIYQLLPLITYGYLRFDGFPLITYQLLPLITNGYLRLPPDYLRAVAPDWCSLLVSR